MFNTRNTLIFVLSNHMLIRMTLFDKSKEKFTMQYVSEFCQAKKNQNSSPVVCVPCEFNRLLHFLPATLMDKHNINRSVMELVYE